MKEIEYSTEELQELFGIESDNLEDLMEQYDLPDEAVEFLGGMEDENA